MSEHLPEHKKPSPDQLVRAYEQGILMGAELKNTSHGDAVGPSPEEEGAFQLGLEKGHDILNANPDTSARSWAAGHAVGAYTNSQKGAN